MRGVRYVSWADTTGYATAAKAYVRALARRGVPVSWTPMISRPLRYELHRGRDWPEADLAPVCNRPLDTDTVLIHTVPEFYPDWIAAERARGARVLGYTVWETERLQEHWPAILNQLDGVLVPCSWNVEVFRRSGVTVPIHVVPHLPSTERTVPDDADRAALARRIDAVVRPDDFLFYHIGFWSARKAPFLVLEAFLEAFTGADPVALVIKTSRQDLTRWTRSWRTGFRLRHPSPLEAVRRLCARHRNPPRVVCITDESLGDGEMLALHERGDCFVSLTRAEGWGLGAFDAARLGKPVIMTGYGGQRDYLDPGLCQIIDYRMVPAEEPVWRSLYRAHDSWAEPDMAQAVAALRETARRPAPWRQKATRLGEAIRSRFSTDATLDTLIAALRS